MIPILRPAEPELYATEMYLQAMSEVREHYEEREMKSRHQGVFRSRRTTEFWKQLKPKLESIQHRKCCYCESRVGVSSSPDIEHYRPKRGTRGTQGEYLDDHYWWLQLDWDNLMVACRTCNANKGTWFPLSDESKRAPYRGDHAAEEPLVLNPYVDNPDDHLLFGDDGSVRPLTQRGDATITILRLNRKGLLAERLGQLQRMHGLLAAGGSADAMLADPTTPYLAALRQASERRRGEGAGADAPRPEPTLKLGRLGLVRIELHNFRSIEDLSIDFPGRTGRGAPWLLLLGENAVGKSSVLQALVLTLMGRKALASAPVKPMDVLRYARDGSETVYEEAGWVKIWVAERDDPLVLSFKRGADKFVTNVEEPETTVYGYGSTRLMATNGLESPESDGWVRADNLFSGSVPLHDANSWLLGLWKERGEDYEAAVTTYDLMVRGLRELLRMEVEEETFRVDEERGHVYADFVGRTARLDHLSDGQRTIVALASDIMSMVRLTGTSTHEAEGIVVVDEIGANLHPAWKKRVVSSFRDVFPRLQFIVTTHEPLCLRGMRAGETALLRRDDEGQVEAVTSLPDPAELRVEQLLLSEFFGLYSTVDPEMEAVWREYYRLLRRRRPTAAESRRIEQLRAELRERRHLGDSLRDELMFEVIDRLLARREQADNPVPRKDLSKEAVDKVLARWRKEGLE